MLNNGQSYRVIGYAAGPVAYRRKLLALGFTPGVAFTVERIAPLGDPIVVRLRDMQVCVRQKEFQQVRIEALTESASSE